MTSDMLLTKVLTNPKHGHRLGTSAATWNKIKQAASSQSRDNTTSIAKLTPAVSEVLATNGSGDSRTSHKLSDTNGTALASTATTTNIAVNASASTTGDIVASTNMSMLPLVRTGPAGEICVWHPVQHTYEFWDWTTDSQKTDTTYAGDVLLLQTLCHVPGRHVLDMAYMRTADAILFVLVVQDTAETVIEVRIGTHVSTTTVPAYLEGALTLKVSAQFAVVAAPLGLLHVLRYDPTATNRGLCPLQSANVDSKLSSVYMHMTRPVADRMGLCVDPHDILLRTATCNGTAVCDIVGSWLVYAPTRQETEYYRKLMRLSETAGPRMYTPVKLPAPGPLLYRVVSSVSNSALDKLYKLLELGTKRIRGYLAKLDRIMDKDVSLHSISSSIGSALYLTASKIKKLAMAMGENEVVKVVDLATGQVMAMFKPPGGISHVLISPYDLQMVHANLRGDTFYMWDLCKLPREVALIGKFVRGKTSAAISDMVWFVNNNNGAVRGTNSGFGCISKKLGSVHWYNINYMSCGNESNNYPNMLAGTRADAPSGLFLDSWILPSIKAVSFCKLPSCANMPSLLSPSHKREDKDFYSMNQLAFIDRNNNLRLVSPLNGKHTFKYVLPAMENRLWTARNSVPEAWIPVRAAHHAADTPEFDTPLSQAEIETCTPYLSLINNKNVEFATYDLDDDTPSAFFDLFSDFGQEVPVNVFEFRGSGLATPLMGSDEDLLRKFNDGLDISPESYSEAA